MSKSLAEARKEMSSMESWSLMGIVSDVYSYVSGQVEVG
jgi:hypothetical protein